LPSRFISVLQETDKYMSDSLTRTVYFDNAATTPTLPCALERWQELSRDVFGNPSSSHRKGKAAKAALDECHERFGAIFDIPPQHVIFTSGGTESSNHAIWGALGGIESGVQWLREHPKGNLITTEIEHPATTNPIRMLGRCGATVDWARVRQDGLLDLEQLSEILNPQTRLVSLHHVQNEIGMIQDIKAITRIVRAKAPQAIIHIDAIQSFLRIPVSFNELDVDLIGISGHKVGAPKGVGALLLGRRFESESRKFGSLLLGSTQQANLRPGTVPVPLIGAFTAAVDWGLEHFEENRTRLFQLSERLQIKLPRDQAVINGPSLNQAQHRAPHIVNFSLPGVSSPLMVDWLSRNGFCVSSGSACHSTKAKPNETLMKMGVSELRALSAIRVSFSHLNTDSQVDQFAETLLEGIEQLSS
jgi:cysteine desulfurase